jgi:hypothetical protein
MIKDNHLLQQITISACYSRRMRQFTPVLNVGKDNPPPKICLSRESIQTGKCLKIIYYRAQWRAEIIIHLLKISIIRDSFHHHLWYKDKTPQTGPRLELSKWIKVIICQIRKTLSKLPKIFKWMLTCLQNNSKGHHCHDLLLCDQALKMEEIINLIASLTYSQIMKSWVKCKL